MQAVSYTHLLVEVDIVFENLLFHELLAAVVALVQINGADEGFECIAVHVAAVSYTHLIWLRNTTLLFCVFLENDTRIMTTESKSIGQSYVHFALL